MWESWEKYYQKVNKNCFINKNEKNNWVNLVKIEIKKYNKSQFYFKQKQN